MKNNSTPNTNESMSLKDEFKSIAYKFVSYPIIAIVGFLVIAVAFFNAMPYINMIGFSAFSSSEENLFVYYPIILIIDGVLAVLAIKLVKWFSIRFNGFCKEHICKKETSK